MTNPQWQRVFLVAYRVKIRDPQTKRLTVLNVTAASFYEACMAAQSYMLRLYPGALVGWPKAAWRPSLCPTCGRPDHLGCNHSSAEKASSARHNVTSKHLAKRCICYAVALS